MDYVILDENMPGIRGSQCAKILKAMISEKQLSYFKIYSMGLFDELTMKDYIINFGFDGFIPKPISMTELISLMEIRKKSK
jgi:DNA-binding NarL/FixJ family response regulator